MSYTRYGIHNYLLDVKGLLPKLNYIDEYGNWHDSLEDYNNSHRRHIEPNMITGFEIIDNKVRAFKQICNELKILEND